MIRAHTNEPVRPLTILASAQAARDFGGRIGDVLGDLPHRFIHPDDGPEPDGCYRADVAFMTRDVTGDSGKTDLADTLLRFYEVMRGSPGLRWMQMHSAGADRPIYGELVGRGVVVTTASGSNSGPVAQMAVTGLLALARRLPGLMDAQRRHAWKPLFGPNAPRDLKGQTAVVVGLGPVGLEIARLLKAVGLRVVGVRRSAEPAPFVDETLGFDRIGDVLPVADWLVLACPLTAQTRGLVCRDTLEALPDGASIVNVARGDVVVEDDLVAALRSGRVAGAFLDVFVAEPLHAASPFWTLPNVIVSPHTAGHTTGHYAAVGEIFLDNLARWRDGRPLRNVVG